MDEEGVLKVIRIVVVFAWLIVDQQLNILHCLPAQGLKNKQTEIYPAFSYLSFKKIIKINNKTKIFYALEKQCFIL